VARINHDSDKNLKKINPRLSNQQRESDKNKQKIKPRVSIQQTGVP
jgi:hypothetical protein